MAISERLSEILFQPVTVVKNVGASRAAAFNRVGVSTVGDLLRYFPRAYQNRGATKTIEQIKDEIATEDKERSDPCSVVITVSAEPYSKMIRRGMTITRVKAFDDTGFCEITFFNQPYVRDYFRTGAEFRLWGRFEYARGRLTITSPVWEPAAPGADLPPIVPVYPLTQGLTQKTVSQAVSNALALAGAALDEYLPENVLQKSSLPTYSYAIRNIHCPASVEALEEAKRRLAFDELLLTSLALSVSGGNRKIESSVSVGSTDLTPLTSLLPYSLTPSQKRSVGEILRDMSGDHAMNRILVGDVGSGKTVVAAAAAYAVMRSGYSAALMAPTEILALQHYTDLMQLFEKLGLECMLLTGSTGASQRKKILAALSDPSEPVLIIGTHALISPDVDPVNLGLVIIDEQHRFGVMQRAALADKTEGVHTLVMSATPIPRTLSLIAYGNLAVSRLDELPSGRLPIDTFAVDESYRRRLNGFIQKQVDEGHQVYVVCPAVEEVKKPEKETDDPLEMANITLFDLALPDDDLPMKSAVAYTDELKRELPGCRIAFVHGKMRPAEKDSVMRSFASGDIDVLVSTTVIEVGVNVPNATLMIVENAERFGLSQLHQLRGRVGRGGAKSYFVMVSDSKSEKALQRISVLKNSRDGYEIAEADLRQRGPGDILSENSVIRQHGQSSMLLVKGCTDAALLETATEAVTAILGDDPALIKPANAGIRSKVERLVAGSAGTIS